VPSSLMPLYTLYQRNIGFNAGLFLQEPYYGRFNLRSWDPLPVPGWSTGPTTSPPKISPRLLAVRTEPSMANAAGSCTHSEETGWYYAWSQNPCETTWKNEPISPRAPPLFPHVPPGEVLTLAKLNQNGRPTTAFRRDQAPEQVGRPAGSSARCRTGPKTCRQLAPYLDAHGFFFSVRAQERSGHSWTPSTPSTPLPIGGCPSS